MGPVQFTIQAILIFATIYLLNRYFSKTLPTEMSDNSRKIKPSKVISVFSVVVCAAMSGGGLWLAFSDSDQIIGMVCAAMGLFAGVVMLPSVTKHHDVIWDEQGIYGPSGKSFPRFPTKQIRIDWANIRKSDEAWSNYRYVEDVNGRRIFWGYWYPGEMALRTEIARRINA